MESNQLPEIRWYEGDCEHRAGWRSEAGIAPHADIRIADDRTGADDAYRLLEAGTALLWRGDWVNARHLMQALTKRADRRFGAVRGKAPKTPAEAFARHRETQGKRAALLNRLLVPLDADYSVPLRRAQDAAEACRAAYGELGGEESLVALRELLAVISAHEWRKKGVPVPAVQGRIHPHYGVFSPVRGEYVALVADAPLPEALAADSLAFDIGTGTGVLAAVLAKRGVQKVVATDQDERALACARENVARLGFGAQVDVVQADLFPPGRAPLIVCNPPWVPARPSSPLEFAVYDPDSRMLRGFLDGLVAHLAPGGEGWLILSDLAEHLRLRPRSELLALIDQAGLKVLGRIDVRPRHPRAADKSDPLYKARSAEVTSLWRLVSKA